MTLITGASGFVGSHVARALAERGDELRILARRSSNLDLVADLDFDRATGDVTDRRAVRRAMDGVQRVFHAAGRTSLRDADREVVWDTNVRGTAIVLESALEAGVERAVLTSSVSAVGASRTKRPIDESASFEIGGLGITYVNSKHEAEVAALRLAARGLPLVIVNPSFVLGPRAPRGTSMDLVRRFLLRRIPLYVDGGLNIVDVRDVATGHLLADEKGAVGERYILSGRNFTLDRLFADLGRIADVDPPPLKLPGRIVLAALEAGSKLGAPVPVSPDEVRSAMLWWTFRNAKAKSELGFEPRAHEETLEDAIEWQREQLPAGAVPSSHSPADHAARAMGSALRWGERVLGR